MVDSAEPRLPPELERVIFEMAAYNDRNRGDILMLMRVARRTRSWLEPILYEIAIFTTSNGESDEEPEYKFYRSFPRPPHISQMRYVRHLLLEAGGAEEGDEDPNDPLLQCVNLENFAMWGNLRPSVLKNLLALIHSPHRTVPHGLLRLSGSLFKLFPNRQIDFNHEVLRELTHLDAVGHSSVSEWKEGNNYACLKNLRYLSLSFPDVYPRLKDTVRRCLAECPALEILLILLLDMIGSLGQFDNGESGFGGFMDELPKVRRKVRLDGTVEEVPEDRVVVYHHDEICLGDFSWVGDWVEGAVGGDDLWTRAEKVVKERRRRGVSH
ncbi:hypothetical protein AX16_002455 [Volvariella volvacea WC 439]|nr:hypothetical protein AX16_002455 [Volvariella volvacea WC 439]